MFGNEAINALRDRQFTTVLDVGAGNGAAGHVFASWGKDVTSSDIVDKGAPNLVEGDFMYAGFGHSFDLIWASHVLEHQLNVNAFLQKCRSLQEQGNLICITVPPLKHEIVGGHVTLWNAGLVMYNLILAGYNCNDCSIKQYGYNISVIAKADNFTLPALHYDYGDIEKLSPWFPPGYNYQGFNGNIQEFNWPGT